MSDHCECEADWEICDKCRNPPPDDTALRKEIQRLDREEHLEKRVKELEELCGLVASTAHVAFKPDDGFVIPSDVVRRCGRAWRGEPLDT